MGQVPVRVVGAVALNDYIIPTGNNDGLAIAVHPKDMKTLDFGKIIGVAWESAESHPINFINVAVGINTNDLAAKVEELSTKVEKIETLIAGKMDPKANFSNLELTANLPKVGSTSYEKSLSDAEFDAYLDQHTMEINTIYQQVRSQLEAQHYNFNSNPLLLELINNPVEMTKKLRRNPAYATQWGLVDQKIQLKK
jgi:biotin-(acetyl-CoA carboxylase) ligase